MPKLLFVFILACASCGHGKSGDWEYQYEVINPRTRSEYVSGNLLYKGSPFPGELQHVITPVGEFIFRSVRGWGGSVPLKWLPLTIDQNGKTIAASRAIEVKNLLAEKGEALRTTKVAETGAVSAEAVLSGPLNQPPKGVGVDWFYQIDSGRWVNPKKLDQALKSNP